MSAMSRAQPHPVTCGRYEKGQRRAYRPQLQPPLPQPPSVWNLALVTRNPPPGYSDSSTYSIVAPSQYGWLCESIATGMPARSKI